MLLPASGEVCFRLFSDPEDLYKLPSPTQFSCGSPFVCPTCLHFCVNLSSSLVFAIPVGPPTLMMIFSQATGVLVYSLYYNQIHSSQPPGVKQRNGEPKHSFSQPLIPNLACSSYSLPAWITAPSTPLKTGASSWSRAVLLESFCLFVFKGVAAVPDLKAMPALLI